MLCNSSSMRATQYTSATALRNAKSARCTVVQATRRELGLQLLTVGTGLLGVAGASVAAEQDANKSVAETANSSSSSGFITITPINKSAKSYMDMRDEAMEYQCSGGMFDCDGDRREFAHKQYMDWLNSGGVPKRIRDGNPKGPKSY